MSCNKCIYRYDKLTYLGFRQRCRRYPHAKETWAKCVDYKEKA
jgi:hypothetical protein